MISNSRVRQAHRWVAVLFVVSAVMVTIVIATQEAPAQWIYLSPLLPLALLVISGAVLFVQPYRARARRATAGTEAR